MLYFLWNKYRELIFYGDPRCSGMHHLSCLAAEMYPLRLSMKKKYSAELQNKDGSYVVSVLLRIFTAPYCVTIFSARYICKKAEVIGFRNSFS